jgi:hypothetical protein
VYFTTVQALFLDLHIKAVRGVHSNSVFEFPIEIYKFEVMPKPWDSTTEVGKIPAGEIGV